MKKIFITALSGFLLIGCAPKETDAYTESNSKNFTYDGFYDGMKLSKSEKADIAAGALHISQSYLLPTAEYSNSVYPFAGTTQNGYIDRHKDDIISFVEQQFYEEYKIEIKVRDDRMLDYIENKNTKSKMHTGEKDKVDKALIVMRYDVLEVSEYPNYKSVIGINYDLLKDKNIDDEFDMNILIPYYEGMWFDDETVIRDVASTYYKTLMNTHFSEVINSINDYFILSDNYYVPNSDEVCLYGRWPGFCAQEGVVSVSFGYSSNFIEYREKHGKDPEGFKRDMVLFKYFTDNQMTVDEIVNYINEDEYYQFGLNIRVYVSKELFEKYSLSKLGQDEKELNQKFTNENLTWLIADKDNIKEMISNSTTLPFEVSYSVSYGYKKFDNVSDNSFFGKYNLHLPMRIYDGDYPWLTEDIIRDNEYGNANQFEWEDRK